MNRAPGRKILRWGAWLLGGLAGLALVAATGIYIASELLVQRTYPGVVGKPVAVPRDSASVAAGARLVQIYGCSGCHAEHLQGQVFFDEPRVARLVAPNLTHAVQRYSDAELERIIRHGIRPTGRSVIAMPSDAFAGLSDASLARILAYLRTRPVVEGPGPSLRLGPLGRLGVATGKFKTAAMLIPPDTPAPPAAPPTDSVALGSYLAHTACAECHGTDLRGDVNLGSVNLAVVSGYSPDEFVRLLQTGIPKGGRKLGLMAEVAQRRFVALNPTEVAALYAYLHSRSGQS
jgi:cytochrome c553